jgi:probable rRNA maturation factor
MNSNAHFESSTKPMKSVQFRNADQTFLFPKKTELKLFIAQLFKKEFRGKNRKLLELTYVFCSDEFLLQINQDHLKHDFYTDIITFDLSEQPTETIGEIYISLDRIRNNAQTYQTSIKEETLRVIFHGALHLCGYKDKSPAHIKEMRNKEDWYIQLYKNQ